MVDLQTVCSMCGDVGFPDKLFRCSKCRHRFQHSYCSNYYSESSSESIKVCDWCQSEGKSTSWPSRRPAGRSDLGKQNDHKEEESGAGERPKINPNGTPSPRTATRRYKLLKDVMC